MPAPGRWTESLPAGVCPGTRPAGTTAPQPAPGTPGGGGVTRDAVHGATCQTGDPLNRDIRNKPEGPKRQIRINRPDKATFKRFLYKQESLLSLNDIKLR